MFKFDSPIIKSSFIAVSIAISTFSFNVQAALNNGLPDNYLFSSFGNNGVFRTQANAINDAGQVVGFSLGYFGNYDALLWDTSNGTTTSIGGSVATGINNYGQIVGSQGSTPYVPLYWEASNATPVGLSMNGNSIIYGGAAPNAINNTGKVVGYIGGAYGTLGSIWDTSTNTVTSLGTLGTSGGAPKYTFAKGINNSDQVVGYSNIGTYGYNQALMWNTNKGTTNNLGALLPSVQYPQDNPEFRAGWASSEAKAINESGLVVGDATFVHQDTEGPGLYWQYSHAMLWDTVNNNVTQLASLALDTQSYANDINDAGLIVGESGGVATLWSEGNVYNLNSFLDESTRNAGWVLNTANGINSNGWIVGNASNVSQGLYTAFLLAPVTVPVPEPETYAMILAGLGLMGFVARRQKKNQA